jgi:hypothetical protein
MYENRNTNENKNFINLISKGGLCNAAKDLKPKLISAVLLTCIAEHETVFIPRIGFSPTAAKLNFILKRRKFPVKLTISVTINRTQGKTLEKVELSARSSLLPRTTL